MTLRVVFMGTPQFAVPTLGALHRHFRVVGVITQPDKPKGRGRKPLPTPVKELAIKLGLPVEDPASLLDPEAVDLLRSWDPDVIVVAAYGKILPAEVLQLPRMGCVNLHGSLLPRHRGASPIAGAILAGDNVTGVCTMLMDEGMDTGHILLQQQVLISDRDTSGSLHDKLMEPGAELVVKTLEKMAQSELEPIPQDHSRATYTSLLRKEDGRIDWTMDAERLSRLVRAFNPWPGAFFQLGDDTIKGWEAVSEQGTEEPGRILALRADGIAVGTGKGVLVLKQVQAPGKNRINAAEFARGRRLEKGQSLM